MPNLSVTLEQGMRLWQLERALCAQVLEQLVHDRVLICRSGKYRLPLD